MSKIGDQQVVTSATINGETFKSTGDGVWRDAKGNVSDSLQGPISVNEKTGAFDALIDGEHNTFSHDGSKFIMHGNGSIRELSPTGQLVKTIDVNRNETHFGYDEHGALNRVEISEPREGAQDAARAVYERGADNWTLTQPDGSKIASQVQFKLDADGTLVRTEGNRILTTKLDGFEEFRGPSSDGGTRIVQNDGTRIVLSPEHQIKSITDSLGRHTEFDYDANGQIKFIETFPARDAQAGAASQVYMNNGDGTWSLTPSLRERIATDKTFSLDQSDGTLTISQRNQQTVQRTNGKDELLKIEAPTPDTAKVTRPDSPLEAQRPVTLDPVVQQQQLSAAIEAAADNNFGAAKVLTDLIAQSTKSGANSVEEALKLIDQLQQQNITGGKIWQLYKDVAKENIGDMLTVLKANQLGVVSNDALTYAMSHRGEGLDLALVAKEVEAKTNVAAQDTNLEGAIKAPVQDTVPKTEPKLEPSSTASRTPADQGERLAAAVADAEPKQVIGQSDAAAGVVAPEVVAAPPALQRQAAEIAAQAPPTNDEVLTAYRNARAAGQSEVEINGVKIKVDLGRELPDKAVLGRFNSSFERAAKGLPELERGVKQIKDPVAAKGFQSYDITNSEQLPLLTGPLKLKDGSTVPPLQWEKKQRHHPRFRGT